ncbi:MAG: tripartite tricarboxylate transporter permease [Oscillospiraceae bacterium]|nr:tripartite tricarboxylate transporter permease [Oscillospiraceae bacterium]
MLDLGVIAQGFSAIFLNPFALLVIVIGTTVGVVLGATPGISNSMAVVLAVPFAIAMDPMIALAFLTAIYCASITGGSIPAILFRIPGTPSSAPTALDGYAMTTRGESGKALGIALIGSAIGGMVAALAMLFISPQLTQVALTFGPAELAAIAFLGLSVLTFLDQKNIIPTIISGLIGLFLATVGMDPIYGYARFTWGNSTLLNGVPMIPTMIGLFAIIEVLKQTVKRDTLDTSKGSGKSGSILMPLREWFAMKWTVFRASVLGTAIGLLPGAGATIASFLGYATETRMSKDPSSFGQGNPKGVLASECSSNAAAGASLVPLLSLGIPGGPAAAIMMTALTIQGVQMGPMLLVRQPEMLTSVFAAMALTNVVMVIVAVWIAKIFSKILDIPYTILGTCIFLMSAVGSFALSSSTGDVMIMVLAGVIGYALITKIKFNAPAIILGLVLGDMIEANFSRAITLARGDMLSIFMRPITGVILLASLILLLMPIIKPLLDKRKKGDS